MPPLPHCAVLFERFFLPWHSEHSTKSRVYEATFPDMIEDRSLAASPANWPRRLTDEGERESLRRIEVMTSAAHSDYAQQFGLAGDMGLTWIRTVDQYYDCAKIQAMIDGSDPADFSNDYVILCCEFGAALGHVLKQRMPRLGWFTDWPYWDSWLADPATGIAIPPFHWAIKKMSECGVRDGFAEKVEACLQAIEDRRAEIDAS